MGVFTIFFWSSRRRHTTCALVTEVQACALPISPGDRPVHIAALDRRDDERALVRARFQVAVGGRPMRDDEVPHLLAERIIFGTEPQFHPQSSLCFIVAPSEMRRARSERRRVGKEWASTGRSRWAPPH